MSTVRQRSIDMMYQTYNVIRLFSRDQSATRQIAITTLVNSFTDVWFLSLADRLLVKTRQLSQGLCCTHRLHTWFCVFTTRECGVVMCSVCLSVCERSVAAVTFKRFHLKRQFWYEGTASEYLGQCNRSRLRSQEQKSQTSVTEYNSGWSAFSWKAILLFNLNVFIRQRVVEGLKSK